MTNISDNKALQSNGMIRVIDTVLAPSGHPHDTRAADCLLQAVLHFICCTLKYRP
ncbi:hypothetical protein [Gemmatimonas sp.]|uniref:hypothetical protein n=1 Tax=Gemmatimonas sp. TaxID=1962908 RepID=UPI0037C09314